VKFGLQTSALNISHALTEELARDLEFMITNVFARPDFRVNIAKSEHRHAQITLAKMVQPVLIMKISWEEVFSATLSIHANVLPDLRV